MRGCDLNTYDLIIVSQLIEKEIESLEETIRLANQYIQEKSDTVSEAIFDIQSGIIEDGLGVVVARKENLEEMLFKIGYKQGEE